MATAAQSRIKSVSYAKYGYIFILPFFIVYFVFMLYPLIETFRLAFYGNGFTDVVAKKGIGGNNFVGLENFKALLFGNCEGKFSNFNANHSVFFRDFKNTIIIWIGNFIPQISLSLLLAVWFTDLNVKMPGKGFFKVVMYMPNIITAASVAGLYFALLGPSHYSVINLLLKTKETGADPVKWLEMNSVWPARFIIMFIQVWMWFGNTMIMLMSGIQGINESLFEAAEIDGASSSQTFWRITLPLLKTIMVYTLLTSMIGGLQMFDIPYMLNKGTDLNGNGIITSCETVAVFIYNKFHGNDTSKLYGISGAASVILFIITAILGALVFYVQRDKDAIEKNRKRKQAIKEAKRRAKGGGFSI